MKVERTDSTNSLMRELIAAGNPPEYIYAGYQTAGRGQAGNGWESEEGKNLLCSVRIDISRWPLAISPFYLNVAVSVAVCLLVKTVFERSGLCSLSEAVSIKWPNDIYWKDKKIAGILVENAIIGNAVRYSIAGIGLNVNQTVWQSDAPNPISLKQIAESFHPSAVSHQIPDYNPDELMQQLYAHIQDALKEDVWDYYKAHLYRREGLWPFVEREVSTAPTMNATTAFSHQHPAISFMARIEDVLPTGEIVLRDEQGQERKYHFKQVRYVI